MKIKTILFIALLLMPFYSLKGQEKTDVLLYAFADKLPQFGNTDTDLYAYIYNHFEWPGQGQFDAYGRIIVSIIVTKKGKVTNIKVEKSLMEAFDEAIKDVFNRMPLWKPGEKDGKPIDIKLYLPIDIELK